MTGTVRTNHDPAWTRIDQATNAYGQGIAVTPVQLLQAVAVFANDGQLVRPRLVRATRGPDGEPPDLAGLHRELAANVPSNGFESWRPGTPTDRNTILLLPAPF